MPRITSIKQKIGQLDPGTFQVLCDEYLYKLGHKKITSLGMKAGTHKTTKGVPDTYFKDSNEKYVLAVYTTQQTGNPFEKIRQDIESCFTINGLEESYISKIICCHTSSDITIYQDKELHDLCEEKGVQLDIFGIDQIAVDLCHRFPFMALDFLQIPLSTNQIFYSVEDFATSCNLGALAVPLDTRFQFRTKELEEMMASLMNNDLIILSGQSGVGKTKLALECLQQYSKAYPEYELRCIRNNHLNIYEDLSISMETPGRYLLLVDDGNEIENLEHIFDYCLKKHQGYDVKIILTVRQYAKDKVLQVSNEKIKFCHHIEITRFTDKEIDEIMQDTFGISNYFCLDQIRKLAGGNVRLALMAGKIAYEQNTLDSIKDVAGLYDIYYGRFLDKYDDFKTDKNLCATAGLCAFLKRFDLHDNRIETILGELEISKDEFQSNINKIYHMEVVDVYKSSEIRDDKKIEHEIVIFSDQCLANFFIKYVCVDREVIPLDLLVRTYFIDHDYDGYKQLVIDAIRMLCDIFQSDTVITIVKDSLIDVWNELKKQNGEHFIDFMKEFYEVNPLETLIFLSEKITEEKHVDFNVEQLQSKDRVNSYCPNDYIIATLAGFAQMDSLEEALDLLFQYFEKRSDLYPQFYNSILQHFDLTHFSSEYNFNMQITLVNKFKEYSKNWSIDNVNILFIDVSQKLLRFGMSSYGYTYHYPFSKDKKLPGYHGKHGYRTWRNLVWNGLLDISMQPKYRNKLKELLEDYGSPIKPDKSFRRKILEPDWEYIKKFFDTSFSPSNLDDCICAYEIKKIMRRFKFDDLDCFSPYWNHPDFEICNLLRRVELEIEEYDGRDFSTKEKIDRDRISKYLKDCDIEKVKHIMNSCLNYTSNLRRKSGELSMGLGYVFEELFKFKDHGLLLYAVDFYISSNNPVIISPGKIISQLFEFLSESEVYSLLSKYEYDMKNLWIFNYFSLLSENKITEKHVPMLYDFLENQEKDNASLTYRPLNFFDKYEKHDHGVFLKCCEILMGRLKNTDYVPVRYFEDTFMHYHRRKEYLILKFKDRVDLLSDIYIEIVRLNKNIDYDGELLSSIYDVCPSILEKYLEMTMDKIGKFYIRAEVERRRLKWMWEKSNYLEIANKIMQLLIKNTDITYPEISYGCLDVLISDNENDSSISSKVDEWITSFITQNCNNKIWMAMLSHKIVRLSPERKTLHILHFCRSNPDYDFFNKYISLAFNYAGWSGGIILSIKNEIMWLEKLELQLKGVKFLKHRKRIEEKTKILGQEIKLQELMEKRRGY